MDATSTFARPEEVEAALEAARAVHDAMGTSLSQEEEDKKIEAAVDGIEEEPSHDRPAINENEPAAKKLRTTTTAGQSRVRRVGRVPKLDLKTVSDHAEGTLGEAAAASISKPFRAHSKHDEKWNDMFNKLLEYQKAFKSTLVPQSYNQEPRLGRWVHYQRVEYWLFQSKGKAKITPERIARLDSIGFEWDPQRAQWENNYKRLQSFQQEHDHCKVPKGYTRDPELANWVRNQRLEYTNFQRGKKTRMTEDRLQRLEAIGFKWSISKSNRSKKRATTTDDEVGATSANVEEL